MHFCALAVTIFFATQTVPVQMTPEDALVDFEALWTHVAENYAYFDEKLTDWPAVRKAYRTQLETVRTKNDLIAVLEAMMAELHDPHAHLNANTADSPPLIPSGTDLWAEWRDGKAVIVDVRQPSVAYEAGIRPLAEIQTIDGVPVARAIESRLGRSLRSVNDQVRSRALRVALAGRRNSSRTLGIMGTTVTLPSATGSSSEVMTARVLPDNIGYINIIDSLGNDQLVGEFDAALARLKDTSGLVIDLRNTPGGGNTTVARGILGRFVTRESPYQRHVLIGEERATGIRRSWLELVSPRGPFTYRKRVVVLVNHWTGSMGEGLAIGFDATRAGTVVGTEMAGLLGATYHFTLPRSAIGLNIPTERLTHIDGTPRESFRPKVYISPQALAAAKGDAILEAGLRHLRKPSS